MPDNILFVGVDLAWSPRNATGLAALRWHADERADGAGVARLDEVFSPKLAFSDDEIVAYVEGLSAPGGVVIAVDAPLTVPNATGRRPGEAELSAAFRKFHAGAHPANRERLGKYGGYADGGVRGEKLVERLAALGIRHASEIVPRKPTRQVFEVYPHPAMVTLFGLDHILRYKAKPKRLPAVRLQAFRVYQAHLHGLADATPPAHLSDWLLAPSRLEASGAALKHYEDQLDAVFCAYLALYYWWWGAERCRIFGTFEGGYIVAPVDDRTRPNP